MKIKTCMLRNGSKLIVVSIPQSLSITLMAISQSGPVFDPTNKTGLSHLIEHLLFKGTIKYPNSEILSKNLEKYGATSAAFSYHETNAYWIKIHKKYLNTAIEILTQQIQNSLFRVDDIEYEKNIIQEELSLVNSNPSLLIWELWAQTIWEGNQLGRIYTGKKEEINSLTQKDVLDFFETHYTAPNTIFVVSGDIDLNKAKQSLSEKLNNYSRQIKNQPPSIKIKNRNSIKIINQEADSLTVMYGFLTTNRFDKDSYILELIEYILGQGQGSYLNQSIANQGLTYSIYTSTKHLSNTGYFSINFTSRKSNLNTILRIINEQINIIKNGGMSNSELERAKGYYIGQLTINNDTTDSLASWVGYQAIYGTKKILSINDKQKIISKINQKDIVRVANKYLNKNKSFISAIGPITEKDIKI